MCSSDLRYPIGMGDRAAIGWSGHCCDQYGRNVENSSLPKKNRPHPVSRTEHVCRSLETQEKRARGVWMSQPDNAERVVGYVPAASSRGDRWPRGRVVPAEGVPGGKIVLT